MLLLVSLLCAANIMMRFVLFFLLFSTIDVVVNSSQCPCSGPPPLNDIPPQLICDRTNGVINGIRGKNVCHCQRIKVRNKFPITCRLKKAYNPADDQPLLHTQGNGYVAYRIFHPGYYNQHCYDDKLFCAYDIQCEKNQFLFYQFSTHKIDNPADSGECLDFLTLTRDSLGGQDVSTCGCVGVKNNTYSDFNITKQDYEPQKLQVHFRSNKKCRAGGYFLWAFCIDTSKQFSPGCLSSRERREVHVSPTMASPIMTAEYRYEIKVPFGTSFVYRENTLFIKRNEVGYEKYSATSLTVVSGDFSKTYKSTADQPFYGTGKLQIYGLSAFYYVFGVPHEYRLTQAETEVVDRLLSASVSFFSKGNQYYISDDRSRTNSISALSMFQRSEKQSRSAKRCVKEQLLQLADKSAQSCNAIVKSVGEFFQNAYRHQEC